MSRSIVNVTRTQRWEATLGLVEGYWNPETPDAEQALTHALEHVKSIWASLQERALENDRSVIAAIFTAGQLVYPAAWGGPPGGEPVVTLSGTLGMDYYDQDRRSTILHAQRTMVVEMCHELRIHFKQSTLRLAFWACESQYLFEDHPEGIEAALSRRKIAGDSGWTAVVSDPFPPMEGT